jgi:hypothetical protein
LRAADGEGVFSVFRRRLCCLYRSPRVVESPKQADSTDDADQNSPTRPVGRIAGRVGGLPLRAKIGIASITAFFAWPIQFKGLDWFDGLGGRRRDRWRGLGWICLSFGLLGWAGWVLGVG